MVFDKIKTIVADQFALDPDTITEETSFIDDLDADSLDLVELACALEDEYGLSEIDEDQLASLKTVGDVVEFINKATDY